MRRILLAALVLTLTAAAAEGREGVYRGPNGAVPPGLREPSDPTPPPPPPPSGAPSTPPAPRPRPGPSPTPTFVSFEDWAFWYHHEKDAFEWRPGRIRPEGVTAPVYARVVAALAAEARASDDHVSPRAAALLALARSTNRSEDAALLLGLAMRSDLTPYAQETAALSLGLLRRTSERAFLDAAFYDRARTALFLVLASDGRPSRTRAFAGCALGLLGDQPTSDAAGTTARLFAFLEKKHRHQDLYLGALRGIALQPPSSVTSAQRDLLREMAGAGTIGGAQVGAIARSQALLALGAQGEPGNVPLLLKVLENRRIRNVNARRSAAIALGRLGGRLGGPTREIALGRLLADLLRERDGSTKGFALMAVVDLLGRGSELDRALRDTTAGEALLLYARHGTFAQRPLAALGLGLLVRRLPAEGRSPEAEAFATKALRVLQDRPETRDARIRAGFALALGLANDTGSVDALRTLAADPEQHGVLRAYCLQGLALMEGPHDASFALLRTCLTERTSEVLRRQSACALGLAGDAAAVPMLLDEMLDAKSATRKCEAAAALARLGTIQAAEGLLALATAPDPHPLLRAAAYAGLGRIADGEPVPSMHLLTTGINYRASSDVISALFAIL